jgi:hypothetical protein
MMRVAYRTIVFATILAAQARAQQATPPEKNEPIKDIDRTALEEVHLKDGTVFRGLVESEEGSRLYFAEVLQARGRPTSMLIHPIDRNLVARRKSLLPAQRAALAARLDRVRHRAGIEAGRREALVVTPIIRDGRPGYQYDGEWFTLDSTADEEITRRCVVRIEQVFVAYRRLLPPLRSPSSLLRVRLLGTMAEYVDYTRARGLELQNLAYFSTAQNEIVAGSELARFGVELAKARAQNDAARRFWQQESAKLAERLDAHRKELEAAGVSEVERRAYLVATRKRFEQERDAQEREIRAAERRNLASFDKFAERMFRRLHHEAFHAYLENYLYPHNDLEHQAPRWLNEGLAQVFEQGTLDDETLRIDVPNKRLLARLQDDVQGASPLRLADLLDADERLFLVAHPGGARASEKHYLYSWGLVHYLIFGNVRFDRPAFQSLCALKLPPTERLEQVTGMTLTEFESQWRAAVLKGTPYTPD